MSGHSKWAKIKHKKGAEDAKRGMVFTKVSKEITAAAKDGGGNTETNIRLRAAIQRARGVNMPAANIDNAIKKGTGELPGIVYENFTFDAYASGGVAVLIDGLTDNKNRTTAEIRNMLSKKGGSLAGPGQVAYLFTKKGYIAVDKSKISEDALTEVAIEAGAEDLKTDGDTFEITCEPSALEAVKSALTAKGIEMQTAEVTMLPTSTVKVTGPNVKTVLELMEALEDHEDIQHVHANFDISEEDMAKASEG